MPFCTTASTRTPHSNILSASKLRSRKVSAAVAADDRVSTANGKVTPRNDRVYEFREDRDTARDDATAAFSNVAPEVYNLFNVYEIGSCKYWPLVQVQNYKIRSVNCQIHGDT